MGYRSSAVAERLDDRAGPAGPADPVWAAFLRAPVRRETPEERVAFEAAKATGGFVRGAEVSAELAECRGEWPGDAGK